MLAPGSATPSRVEVRPGENQRPGSDAAAQDGRLIISVDRARMFNLIANDEVVSGSLILTALDAGLSAYAFTFTSSCIQDA